MASFEIIDEITDIEVIAIGNSIRDLPVSENCMVTDGGVR